VIQAGFASEGGWARLTPTVMAAASLAAITARRMPPLRFGHPLVIAASLRFAA